MFNQLCEHDILLFLQTQFLSCNRKQQKPSSLIPLLSLESICLHCGQKNMSTCLPKQTSFVIFLAQQLQDAPWCAGCRRMSCSCPSTYSHSESTACLSVSLLSVCVCVCIIEPPANHIVSGVCLQNVALF